MRAVCGEHTHIMAKQSIARTPSGDPFFRKICRALALFRESGSSECYLRRREVRFLRLSLVRPAAPNTYWGSGQLPLPGAFGCDVSPVRVLSNNVSDIGLSISSTRLSNSSLDRSRPRNSSVPPVERSKFRDSSRLPLSRSSLVASVRIGRRQARGCPKAIASRWERNSAQAMALPAISTRTLSSQPARFRLQLTPPVESCCATIDAVARRIHARFSAV